MQCVGKNIMVELPDVPEEVLADGIIIPGARSEEVMHYTGIINNYGTGYSKTDIGRLSQEIPIGSKIYFDWKSKDKKTKIRYNQHWYMVLPEDIIIGIEENE